VVGTAELAPNEKRCSKCKEVKDRGEFSPDRRSPIGLQSSCRDCGKKLAISIRQRNHSGKEALPCPIQGCGTFHLWLLPHLYKIHGYNRITIKSLGISETVAPETHKVFSKRTQAAKEYLRKDNVVTIQNCGISFPRDYWPNGCRFVKVVVSKEKKQVYLKPFLREHSYTKKVGIRPENRRLIIRINRVLLDSLDVERDIQLVKGKGFIIKFTDKDDPLLDALSLWALDTSGQIMKNPYKMTTYSHFKSPSITISRSIWPESAGYALIEFTRTKRGEFIDITPLTEKNNSARKPVRIVKVVKRYNRFSMKAVEFLNNHFIPSGDWDLKEVLPSGALRFRLYKEREAKQEQEAS
jgi:hypothetical protein